MRRMDRYKDEGTTEVSRRSSKNQELYQTIGTNTRYTNFTDVCNANAYDISRQENTSTREGYHRMRQYNNVYDYAPKERKELDDYNRLINNNEHKVYDINSVLENARKNKEEVDILDEKRKLKNNSYNILTSLDKESLEKYREEKKNRIMTAEEEEIRELIDTIASKTLAGEIDKATTVDLLSDLMATSILDKVEPAKPDNKEQEEPEIIEKIDLKEEKLNKEDLKEIEEKVQEDEEPSSDESLPEKDPDFYTRSMDLSDKDFDLSEEFKDKPMPIILKILIILLILAVLVVAGYFIYQRLY